MLGKELSISFFSATVLQHFIELTLKALVITMFRSKLSKNISANFSSNAVTTTYFGFNRIISRRSFLKSLGSLTAIWLISPKLAFASLRWENSPHELNIISGNQLIWKIDVSWLTGNPKIEVENDLSSIMIKLSNAFYPGLNISANFFAKIDFSSSQPTISLNHDMAENISEANFIEWLSGKASLVSKSKELPSINVGSYSKIPKHKYADIEFGPNLNLTFSSNIGWTLSGLETSNTTQSIELQRPVEPLLILENELFKRSHLKLRDIDLNPQISRDKQKEYRISQLKKSNFLIEISENGDTAFRAETSYPTFLTGIDNKSGNHTKTLGLGAQYARMVASNDNTESYFSATQGQSIAKIDQVVIKASPIESNTAFNLYSSSDGCAYDCRSIPQSISFPSDKYESKSIHFNVANSSGYDLLNSNEIPLGNAELNIINPANAMWLKFRFNKGFRLKKTFLGKLKLYASQDCRLHLILQPQAILEQAFYEAPEYKIDDTKASPSSESQKKQIDLIGDSDHELEKAFKEANIKSKRPSPPTSESYAGKSKARIAGESQLVFKPKENINIQKIFESKNPFSIDVLLNFQYWDLVVTRDAASSEHARDNILSTAPTQSDKSHPPIDATYLEIPWGVFISPVESISVTNRNEKNLIELDSNSPQKTTFLLRGNSTNEKNNSFRDIFRLEAKIPEDGLPIRAIGARQFNENKILPNHYDSTLIENIDEFRTALDYRDRHEIVWLTSQWKEYALEGTADVRPNKNNQLKSKFKGVYVPKPFYAEHLILSSMGGSMESYGRWDPPALEKAILSVERWEHKSTFGRDHYDAVYYKGFLLPFGNRCTLIKVTQRIEHRYNDLGVVSIPVQRFYLEISDPIVTYGEFLAPYKGRTWPFRQIELTKQGKFEISNPSLTDINSKGQSAFKVCVGGNPTPFDFEFLIDGDHHRKGIARLAFIDNEVAHSPIVLDGIIKTLNITCDADWNKQSTDPPYQANCKYCIDLKGSKVTFAPSKKPDDTSYVTKKMVVTMGVDFNMVNTALVEASRRPPIFAEMESAEIIVPSINRLTDKEYSTTSNVRIAPLYRDVGFDGNGNFQTNRSEIFLEFTTPINLNFSGKGNRSGGVATPNLNPKYLSRVIGLAGPMESLSSTQTLAGRTTLLTEVFNALNFISDDAKLLGVIPLSWVLGQLGLEDVPKFIESAKHTINEKTSDIGKAAKKIALLVKNQSEDIDLVNNKKLSEKYKILIAKADRVINENDNIKIINLISDISSAITDVYSEIENLVRNPATLLPESLQNISLKWRDSINKLNEAIGKYESFAIANLNLLKSHLNQLNKSLDSALAIELNIREDQFRAYLNGVLDNEISRFITNVNKTVNQNEEDFYDACFSLYAHYSDLYSGAYGALIEINANASQLNNLIINITNAILAKVNDSTSIQNLTNSIKNLDNSFRSFETNDCETNDCENNRSLFRSIEPNLEELQRAYFLISNKNESKLKTIVKLTEASKIIQSAIININQAINNNQQGGNFTAFQDLTLKVNLEFSNYLFSIINSDINNINQLLSKTPNPKGTLGKLISDLLNSLSDGSSEPIKQDRLIKASIGFLTIISLYQLTTFSSQEAEKSLQQFVSDLELFMQHVTNNICDCLETVFFKSIDNTWLFFLSENRAILTNEIVDKLIKLSQDGNSFSNKLRNSIAFLKDPTSTEYQSIIKGFSDLTHDWHELLDMGKRLGEAPDKFVIQKLNEKFLELKENFIPAQISLEFNFETSAINSYSPFINNNGDKDVRCNLKLNSNITLDLVKNQSSASFTGTLSNFGLNLFDLLIINFNSVSFESNSGSSTKLYPPDIRDIKFEEDLKWIDELSKIFKGKNGPYVTPGLNGIKAGYRFDPGKPIAIPPMIIQNLIIDASLELPYDNRAATSTLTLSSRKSPALLFISPYGGACFLSFTMAGDRLVNAEASFEAGIVSGFDLGGVVKGSGRITLGVYYRQNAESIILEGFFFAGGNAVVLNIASIYAALRIGLSYKVKEDKVSGYGEFSVEIGSSPFSWTLSYGVGYNTRISSKAVESQNYPTQFATPTHDIFFNDKNWQLFKSAFADFEA